MYYRNWNGIKQISQNSEGKTHKKRSSDKKSEKARVAVGISEGKFKALVWGQCELIMSDYNKFDSLCIKVSFIR